MVRIEKNKLIIEIDTNSPAEELVSFQRGILRALQCLKLETEDLTPFPPVYSLSELMDCLLLDEYQIKKGLSPEPVECK